MNKPEQQPTLFDRVEGERRKRKGIALVEEHDDHNRVGIMGTIFALARLKPEITSDDLYAALPERYTGFHPNLIGACFHAASMDGTITRTQRFVKSARPSAHSRIIQVWRSNLIGVSDGR